MSSKKKRTRLSYDIKKKIINEVSDGKSSVDIKRQYNISSSTLTRIQKKKDHILSQCENYETKNKRSSKGSDFPELEAAVLKWFYQQRDLKNPITGPILQLKAMEFAKNKYPSFRVSFLNNFRGSK